MTSANVLAAGCCAVAAALLGLLVPRALVRLREPESPAADKPTYTALAGTPLLGPACAVVAGLAAGSIGLVLGGDGSLPVWVYLSAVGVALGFVDWRTKLLPYDLVAPSYLVVGVVLVVVALATASWGPLLRAAIAGVATFAAFFALNLLHEAGMGFGDVRLSGVLGLALGWLGWSQLLVGVYAGFLLGAVVGGVLAVLRVVERKSYPFGPFLLVGAWVGVLTGPVSAGWLH